jgi:hypothetical protein
MLNTQQRERVCRQLASTLRASEGQETGGLSFPSAVPRRPPPPQPPRDPPSTSGAPVSLRRQTNDAQVDYRSREDANGRVEAAAPAAASGTVHTLACHVSAFAILMSAPLLCVYFLGGLVVWLCLLATVLYRHERVACPMQRWAERDAQ